MPDAMRCGADAIPSTEGETIADGLDGRHGTAGRLDVDDLGDALLCHVCGRMCRSPAQHARMAHRLSADDYRRLAGLNRPTRLVSPGMRAHLPEVTAPLIERLRAEGKLRRWDEDPERFQRDKAAAVETIREGLRAEGRRHQHDAATDERRARMAERRRERNLAGTDRASPEAIREGPRRAAGQGICRRCGQPFERTTPHHVTCPDCAAIVERERGREAKRRARLRRALGEEAAPKRADPLARDQSREATCARCGSLFLAASHRERYCHPCRPLAEREYQRTWHARRRAARSSLDSECPGAVCSTATDSP
ncbi:MAG: hypothetical protein JOZ41_04180 [Chloroflexi bacterium]|nr:hypothetical protein [Chloroflexota bacterium]